MANIHSKIEWTDRTWNPTTGCSKVSAGCKYCYAEILTQRFTNHFVNGFQFTLHEDRLEQPLHWRKPNRIFVNSMSDLFHEDMPLEFLHRVFAVMRQCPQHIFQILTKRHERLLELSPLLEWSENIWMGVSVENQEYAHRVDYLRRVPAHVRFLSCEPLIGALELDLTGIHWVITGGESGAGHRPISADWVRAIRDQCLESGVAFFHKQWGGLTPKSGGRELDGVLWDDMPSAWTTHLQRLSTLEPKPRKPRQRSAPQDQSRLMM
jgi:protein gp37